MTLGTFSLISRLSIQNNNQISTEKVLAVDIYKKKSLDLKKGYIGPFIISIY